jgi:hypothetical protein
MIDMKLDEIFDGNYYDYLQDEVRRKHIHDPFEDEPLNDTTTSIQDFIISAYETDQISFEEARKRITAATPNSFEQKFWRMELAAAAELKDDPKRPRLANPVDLNDIF